MKVRLHLDTVAKFNTHIRLMGTHKIIGNGKNTFCSRPVMTSTDYAREGLVSVTSLEVKLLRGVCSSPAACLSL